MAATDSGDNLQQLRAKLTFGHRVVQIVVSFCKSSIHLFFWSEPIETWVRFLKCTLKYAKVFF